VSNSHAMPTTIKNVGNMLRHYTNGADSQLASDVVL
jgi:hypothetical protein